jgi:exoribonuclease II
MGQQYCLFFKNDRLQFGWVSDERKQKLIVQPEQGKSFSCSQNRLEYCWSGRSFSDQKEVQAYLTEKAQWALQQVGQLDLEVIHELCEPGQGYRLQDMAADFLEDPEDGWSVAALLIALKNDSLRFQQKKNEFFARSSEEITRLTEAAAIRAENERRRAREKDWADDLLSGQKPMTAPEEEDHWRQFLDRLVNLLIYLGQSPEKDYLAGLFRCQPIDTIDSERRLLDCLALTDHRLSWGQLQIKRVLGDLHCAESDVSSVAIVEKQLSYSSRAGVDILDQRSLESYTIDGEETRDFDDAISWAFVDGGTVIRCHIADVATFVDRTDAGFERAERRMASLYTLKGVYPMFPSDLSENVFSLKAGADRPVLTFEFFAGSDGSVDLRHICRSIIRVKRNLTYEVVDRLIEDDQSDWSVLWHIATRLKQQRSENGSLELDRVEVKLDISRPEAIRIKTIRENTPATMLVQELAILTNHQAARFCRERGLKCLYRSQAPYSLLKEPVAGQRLCLGDIQLQPARIVLEPDIHSALGLDCYLQVTSPIRRFLDLINQKTILAALTDTVFSFSTAELLIWAQRGEETQKAYGQVERRLLDHWKIRYLEQHRQERFEAEFIRPLRNGRALFNLTALQLKVEGWIDGRRPGELFTVVMDQIDSRIDTVRVKIAGAAPDSRSDIETIPDSVPG